MMLTLWVISMFMEISLMGLMALYFLIDYDLSKYYSWTLYNSW